MSGGQHADVDDGLDAVEDVVGVDFAGDDFFADVVDVRVDGLLCSG